MKFITTYISAFSLCLSVYSMQAASLEHKWSFEETSGTFVSDSIGSNNGTAVGTFDLDVAGPMVTFNGGSAIDISADANSGVRAGTDTSFNDNPSFAISIWFNADSAGLSNDNNRLFEIGNSSSAKAGAAFTVEGGTNGLGFRYGDGNLFWNPAGNLMADTWYHAVLQYDGSTVGDAALQVYLNGTLLTRNGGNGNNLGVGLNISTATLDIGRSPTGSALTTFDGTLDEAQLFSGTLTQAEVTSLYNTNTVAIPEPSTFALIAGTSILAVLALRRKKH